MNYRDFIKGNVHEVRHIRDRVLIHTIVTVMLVFVGLPVLAQDLNESREFTPAASYVNESYRAEIGKALASPSSPTIRGETKKSVMNCHFTCDAFVPRQPILKMHWEDTSSQPGARLRVPGTDSAGTVRLDISGTPRGFKDGNYNTIKLSNIPTMEKINIEAEGGLQPSAGGQVLLNYVKNGRIIERPGSLPIFKSPDVMTKMLPTLPANVSAAVEQDQRVGSLGQVRVLGRSKEVFRGQSQETVAMMGLQPGMTYRVRVVEEQGNGAQEVVESICRVPVCPADYIE